MDLIKVFENTKRNLEQEIQGFRAEAQRQAKSIYGLEKEREKYGTEASEAGSKYMQVGGHCSNLLWCKGRVLLRWCLRVGFSRYHMHALVDNLQIFLDKIY